MRTLILHASPRRDGNSAMLADACRAGLVDAGHAAEIVHADDAITHMLRDCRTCRNAAGDCTIADGYADLFADHFLPAEGFVLATPIYWYGMSAQAKVFFDRMFCYQAKAYPGSDTVVRKMTGKRIGLLVSAEENYPAIATALIHQVQEYARYTRSTFVGAVRGQGNSRGELRHDPDGPVAAAHRLGATLLSARTADYAIDVARSNRVWPAAA